MRIKKVSVKKLFGIFDHDIPLNQESRITIVHGPNGVGKTVLLRMIHGLFSSKHGIFSEIPFDRFSVHFDVGGSLYVDQNRPERQLELSAFRDDSLYSTWNSSHAEFTIWHSHQPGSNIDPYNPARSRERSRFYRYFVESQPELERMGPNRWFNDITGSFMTMEDVITAYDLEAQSFEEQEPEWLNHIKSEIHTQFIETQRLQGSAENGHEMSSRRRIRHNLSESAVERYSGEIARKIQSKLTEYGQRSQRIDSSFPTRLLEAKPSSPVDKEALQKKLSALEKKSSELRTLGIFEEKDAPEIPRLDIKQDDLTNVLSIYVQDIEDKLSVFDDIVEQLRILTDIINTRFRSKMLKIDKQEGFVILAHDDKGIPIQSLSSGEQHELVLFYQLLFDAQPNSLIMIDEPEISLHVNWQEHFLNDIQRVSDLRKFDVLIATHSPDIISDKHEWMVGLGEVESA